ncbi:MAG: hypothetical protein DMF95_30165 [Acidobacteria bacterium]|nr:MAG: hypothetical protein DMF94_22270 [Acidobacteriota bacterium]PYR41717.1 MAG: hypothetical protein DMF95_30165 [Acidobacteriota bacterium]
MHASRQKASGPLHVGSIGIAKTRQQILFSFRVRTMNRQKKRLPAPRTNPFAMIRPAASSVSATES